MIRILLDDATRDELRSLRRTDLPAKGRDRIAMVTPSDAGRSAPTIAEHLGSHPLTVRDLLRSFPARGAAALRPSRSGPAPDTDRHGRITAASRPLPGRRRTRTSGQLSRAPAEHGIDPGARQVRRYLKRMGARYRRTGSPLRHNRDPAEVERARPVPANLKARASAGLLKLYSLDECGFAPPLPTGSRWTRPGGRKSVAYEAPRGRRVNALAAYRPYDRAPRLDVVPAERTWTAYDLLGSLGASPWSRVPRVVAPDDAAPHPSEIIRAARAGSARRGIDLYSLPPSSPELPEIEPVFRRVRYQEMPVRSDTTRLDSREAVEDAFAGYGRRLPRKRAERLRPAAY